MATETRTVSAEPEPTPEAARGALNDMVLLALPMVLFKQLSDAAMKRNMVLSQLLSVAVQDYLQKTEK
jgi:hypothetical protein